MYCNDIEEGGFGRFNGLWWFIAHGSYGLCDICKQFENIHVGFFPLDIRKIRPTSRIPAHISDQPMLASVKINSVQPSSEALKDNQIKVSFQLLFT